MGHKSHYTMFLIWRRHNHWNCNCCKVVKVTHTFHIPEVKQIQQSKTYNDRRVVKCFLIEIGFKAEWIGGFVYSLDGPWFKIPWCECFNFWVYIFFSWRLYHSFPYLWKFVAKHGSEDEVANKKELSGAPLVTSRCEGAMQAALLVFYPGFFVLTCVGAQVSDFQPYLLFEQIQWLAVAGTLCFPWI